MRRFTHHALQTPAAKPLNDWLAKAGPVSTLMQTARQLSVLEAEVLALLPAGMRDGLAVAGVKRDATDPNAQVLLLLAAHGAAAARVRQVVPTLLARLQQRGSHITAIRVRVQPEVSRHADWEVEPVQRQRTGGRMTPTGLANLDQLARSLPDSPLRDALNTLLAHHR
ncbi:hypothetical protein JJQ59_16495 [Cupriavidus necator]|uniref:DUF721 domain-containing protein n=1 Tax=Cupriavidus necator TaxID=106590 RepID=A0A367PFD9_CUPNE|nr:MULTISPECIES: hypothetical protein [Cupriavidus]EON16070.1 hypothetical protein C265_29745 [Cupriavidus sp. GA3-3]KUE85860.1 hypothetical protein ASL20_26350 [Cupriavidus necator]QQX83989.1 hypothetical protein JJQ59_16495 [Cupriavidus necator]RCJ06600.1 hypothetical protein DDK22_20840 [Cupriavidus necator]